MDFIKIKVSKQRVHLEYTDRKDDNYSDYSLDSPDDALLSFSQSIKALREDYLKLLELPTDSEYLERVDIHTINIAYKGASMDRSVIISANIRTSTGSYNVNSPLKALDLAEDNSVSVEFNQRIQKIINEAQKFLDGHRIQGNLFEMNSKAANG